MHVLITSQWEEKKWKKLASKLHICMCVSNTWAIKFNTNLLGHL